MEWPNCAECLDQGANEVVQPVSVPMSAQSEPVLSMNFSQMNRNMASNEVSHSQSQPTSQHSETKMSTKTGSTIDREEVSELHTSLMERGYGGLERMEKIHEQQQSQKANNPISWKKPMTDMLEMHGLTKADEIVEKMETLKSLQETVDSEKHDDERDDDKSQSVVDSKNIKDLNERETMRARPSEFRGMIHDAWERMNTKEKNVVRESMGDQEKGLDVQGVRETIRARPSEFRGIIHDAWEKLHDKDEKPVEKEEGYKRHKLPDLSSSHRWRCAGFPVAAVTSIINKSDPKQIQYGQACQEELNCLTKALLENS